MGRYFRRSHRADATRGRQFAGAFASICASRRKCRQSLYPCSPFRFNGASACHRCGTVALALGFDRPVEGLMDKAPRPLHQPVLSRGQWGFDIALGIVMAIETLWVLDVFEDRESAIVAASMAVVVFSLMNVAARPRRPQRHRDGARPRFDQRPSSAAPLRTRPVVHGAVHRTGAAAAHPRDHVADGWAVAAVHRARGGSAPRRRVDQTGPPPPRLHRPRRDLTQSTFASRFPRTGPRKS